MMMDLDGGGDPYNMLLNDPLLSIVDNSLHHSKYLLAPASVALREAFTCFSKFAGAFVLFFSGSSQIQTKFSDTNLPKPSNSTSSFGQPKHIAPSTKPYRRLPGTSSCFRFPHESFAALFGHKISAFSLRHLLRAAADDVKPFPVLSLAAALIPPLDHFTPSMLAIPPEDADAQMLGSMDKNPCNVQHHRDCVGHAFPEFKWLRDTIEPKTGIQFPGVLNSIIAKDTQSNLSSEVLVGTGSRIMTLIRIKSLKVYAFGFYVHPSSLCQKLGSKYGSVPEVELKERNDFYADLLREDIGMTVRFVVNYSGMKVNTVKDAIEKSLRARLAKTNPETDFKCISTFGSCFTKDIPLPAGTIIDFRRTADGHLITEIGGNQIGAVQSRELCRAFFDMYIGEVPVSEQTKEEIGRNVATIMRRC
ncbi:fatty-acid-binding protein 2-like [Chenopodium quinoa]|uniref:fatty-acid-binding protein 2-like n=1 Tax=Chenopodium quinoa TaxID=63459 RepID=UPI000B77A20B|nr:fatty-acid-binding protein 2-like [Chenopodium quinoa]XP_021762152.1 fatty-acid-binding protein 2-like [Chenopodium quinoa]XP_021762153.1 fatty-acid-binding protein 2-like [Chenopodium quinoa]